MKTRALLLFDGDCAFCSRCVEVVRARIAPDVDFEPWQWVDLAALGVTEREAGHAVQWIGVDGGRASGAAAFGRVLLRAGSFWRIVGAIILTPPINWLAAGIYRLIANNRHRMPGGTAACALPAQQRR